MRSQSDAIKGAGGIGKYTIKGAGRHRDSGKFYLYEDGKYRFHFELRTSVEVGFDPEWKAIDGQFTLYIVGFSKNGVQGGWGDVYVDPADVPGIEANIRDYFNNFDSFGDPRTAKDPVPPLVFLWRLGRVSR